MKTTRALILPGKTPRIWHAELDGARLAITSGTAKKPSTKEETFEQEHEAEDKFTSELLKKLRGGYVLDGAQGGLVAQFSSTTTGISSVSPDGETVWEVDDPSGVPTARVFTRSGQLLATHDLRALGIPQDLVADVVALSKDAALIACASTEVWKLDGTSLRVFASVEGCSGRLRMGGDRVLLRGHRARITLLDLEGNVVTSLENVEACALSDDGRYLATCARDAGELIVWNAKDGTEVRRCSLGEGRGVHDVAINAEHVAALWSYFPASSRRSTQAFSIETGEQVMPQVFPGFDTIGSREALTSTGFVVGFGTFYTGEDATPVREYVEFTRVGSSHGVHVASGGRFVLMRNKRGIVAVWDTTQLPREPPKVESRPKSKLPAPSTDWGGPKSPVPVVTDDALIIPFEHAPDGGGKELPGGLIYSSFADEVSTFVDCTSWPPRTSSRMHVFGAARTASGLFVLQHRDGLWLTRDFAERGKFVPLPRYAEVVGVLGEDPIIFDSDGLVPPLIWRGGEWKEVTGLHDIDAAGGTGAVNLSDGFGFITFRDAAWRVDEQQRATKLFDMRDVNASWAFPTIDGRFVSPLPEGKLVFFTREGHRLVIDMKEKRKVSLGVRPMPGPNRSLLVTYGGSYGKNKTEFIGARISLSGGRPTPLRRADFGLDAEDEVADLFMCGDEVLAYVEGNVFHRLRRNP
ncbi:hypothetical protein LY474_32685 [Myxococcus stipitatus]|uniref:WD40 repeat domain-containing protein n=1 Tax=Myxococcus stipitatus TaxID=83455 RepID=UPI001F1DB2BD|nr:hypothetical protein [Myxococcus stipitatus]MCE9672576.1 hypothetical protein [Myxococcus stipitatus]